MSLTLLECMVGRLECPPLHRIHGSSLIGCDGEEWSIKETEIFIDEVPSMAVELSY